MIAFVVKVLSVIFTSFYLFPFEFKFLPGANTKMIMAGAGLVMLGFQLAKRRRPHIDNDVFVLSLIALSISLFSLTAMVYNNTSDPSFLTYFVSMWVWLGGAYFLSLWLKMTHGYLSIKLVCHYLIVVCVCQCVLAITMNMYSPLKNFVDSFLGGEEAFMGNAGDRLYGIGAALDVAGFRFAAALVIISYLCMRTSRALYHYLYIVAFCLIVVLGSMMGRSAIIGAILSILMLLVASSMRLNNDLRIVLMNFWKRFFIVLAIILPLVVLFYNIDSTFYANLRFGFEGFFSLWEKGYWQTTSTDILTKNMIVFPDNLKTWLIGDGYCANPSDDPYYVGPAYHGYYKGTDIGYLRFIFYFGVGGALALVLYITSVARSCMKRFPAYKYLFLCLLLLNFAEWCKVSTDIFLVFALFLCITPDEQAKGELLEAASEEGESSES